MKTAARWVGVGVVGVALWAGAATQDVSRATDGVPPAAEAGPVASAPGETRVGPPPPSPRMFSRTVVIDPFRRPYMGLQIRDVGDQLAAYFGATNRAILVESVDPEGPGWQAGLRAGDVLVTFEGEPVGMTEDVFRHLDDLRTGDKVAVGVLRQGSSQSHVLTLAQRPAGSEPQGIPREIQDLMGEMRVIIQNAEKDLNLDAMLDSVRQYIPSAQARAAEAKRTIDEGLQRELDKIKQELNHLREELRKQPAAPSAPPAPQPAHPAAPAEAAPAP